MWVAKQRWEQRDARASGPALAKAQQEQRLVRFKVYHSYLVMEELVCEYVQVCMCMCVCVCVCVCVDVCVDVCVCMHVDTHIYTRAIL